MPSTSMAETVTRTKSMVPRVAASADKIEMSGAAFVSIGVKVHSRGPLLHSEMHLEEHLLVALALPIPCGRQE